ncbi:MAG: NAD-dependent epimerase/dehydratase family protein [Ottowia sp.]|uniref:NAD-dependent epimerase/dehydratase family protein n=1 Tax=Ottowia sp. TaxID=1898956 RepID=UPI0039E4A54B
MPSNQTPLGALPARFRCTRVLIIGHGDVGQRVARLLPARVRVLALTREAARLPALRAQGVLPLLGDLDDTASLRRLAGLATHVLHLAPPPAEGAGDPRTAALLRALARRGVPQALVYGSTSGVYGDCGGALIDETRRLSPGTARARRRVAAEQAVRAFGRAAGVRASILRIPGIYAPDREGGTPRARLLRGTPVLAPEDDVFTNHIHADDLARACIAALWRGKPQRVVHANDDSALRMGEYFDLAADLYGLPKPPRISRAGAQAQLPPALLSFMSESRRMDNRRLKRELRLRLRHATPAIGLLYS